MSKTNFVRVRDDLDTKWHNEKHDTPRKYYEIIIDMGNGRYIDGYISHDNMFTPFDKRDAEGLEKLVVKRWRYGMIDRPIEDYE